MKSRNHTKAGAFLAFLPIICLLFGCNLFKPLIDVPATEDKQPAAGGIKTEKPAGKLKSLVFSANGDIWGVKEDGSGLTQLTKTADAERFPCVSPDGKYIAYTRGGTGSPETTESYSDLWIMKSDGTGQKLLSDGGFKISNPTFSPDGKQIAYNRQEEREPDWGNGELWVINTNGTGQKALTARDQEAETNPAWSPDGNILVFESHGEVFSHISLFSFADNTQTSLANEIGTISMGSTNILYEPAWSPDGKYIAFNADWGGIDAHSDLIVKTAIMNATGGVVQVVDAQPEGQFPSYFAGWDKDSGKVYAAATSGNQNVARDYHYDLWSYDIEQKEYRQLSTGGKISNYTLSSESPGYDKVAFVEWTDEDTGTDFIRKYHSLWIMSLDGQEIKKIVEGKEFDLSRPAWSR